MEKNGNCNRKKKYNIEHEIIFLLDSDRKNTGENDDSVYRISSLEEFYSLLEKNKELVDERLNYKIEAVSSEKREIAQQCWQLLSFMCFHKRSKVRLNRKMKVFNEEICELDERHILECTREFSRINSGGKCIRGALVNLGYHIMNECTEEYSDELALALEIFQTAILIHDDIIDHAVLRRKQDTIPTSFCGKWKIRGGFDEETMSDTADSLAICAGDLGMYLANQKITIAYGEREFIGELMRYYNQMIINTIQGEILDVYLPFEEKNHPSSGEELVHSITEIYRLKTAWYTVIGPFCLGMILGGATSENIQEAEEFAEKLGIAFQIKDDILGVFTSEKEMGKDAGSDIAEFKQTLLYAYVAQQKDYKEQLLLYYGRENLSTQDIQAVCEILEKSGALKYAETEMERYFSEAEEKLNGMKFIAENQKTKLLGLIWYLKMRKY